MSIRASEPHTTVGATCCIGFVAPIRAMLLSITLVRYRDAFAIRASELIFLTTVHLRASKGNDEADVGWGSHDIFLAK